MSLLVLLSGMSIPNPGLAQSLNLPRPLSVPVTWPHLHGIALKGNDLSRFDLLMGTSPSLDRPGIERMVRIILAGMTFEPKDIWVNLSPYEADRMLDPKVAQTELGYVLAEQDFLLKQRASALTHPDTGLGQMFWKSIGAESASSFLKVWILPGHIDLYQDHSRVIIGDMRLKVYSGRDYQAFIRNQKSGGFEASRSMSLASNSPVIQALEKEVNESPDFAPLRAVYRALALAYWMKSRYTSASAETGFVNEAKIKGFDLIPAEQIFDVRSAYQRAYKKGSYNLIREDMDAGQKIARRYFSGGISFDPAVISWRPLAKMPLRTTLISAVTVALMALTSPGALASDQGGNFVIPDGVRSVQEIAPSVPSSTARILGYMTAERGRSPLPVQIQIPLTAAHQGRLGAVLVDEIIRKSGGTVRPNRGGGVYQSIVNGGAVWVQQRDGGAQVLTLGSIGTYRIQTGDILVLQNRKAAEADEAPKLQEQNSLTQTEAVGAGGPPDPRIQHAPGRGIAQGGQTPMPAAPIAGGNGSSAGAGSAGGPPDDAELRSLFAPDALDSVVRVNLAPDSGVPRFGGVFDGGVVAANRSRTLIPYGYGDAQLAIAFPPVTIHGGLRGNMMRQRTGGEDPMREASNVYIGNIAPYIGLSVPVPDTVFNFFAEISGVRRNDQSIHLGLERRPAYREGESFTYGISAQYMMSKWMAELWGYYSWKLKDNEYLSVLPRLTVGTNMRQAFAAGVQIEYRNGPWSLGLELNPFPPLRMGRGMDPMHAEPWNFRDAIRAEYRINDDLSLYGQVGHLWPLEMTMANRPSLAVLFGVRLVLGNPERHGGGQPPLSRDFSRSRPSLPIGDPFLSWLTTPANVDNAMLGETTRRRLIPGALIFLAHPASAQSLNRIRDVYRLPEPPFPLCGIADVQLRVGDMIPIEHLLYLSFMYWFIKDPSNRPNNANQLTQDERFFTDLNDWQWQRIIFNPTLTNTHFALARAVQQRMRRAMQAIDGGNWVRPNDKLDGPVRIFDERFRVWIDRWIQSVRFDYNKVLGEITQNAILNYIRFKYPDLNIRNVPAIRQILRQRGYNNIPPVGNSIDRLMVDALLAEINKEPYPDRAQLSQNGGIDFAQLPNAVRLGGQDQGVTEDLPRVQRRVEGMTFKILSIQKGIPLIPS